MSQPLQRSSIDELLAHMANHNGISSELSNRNEPHEQRIIGQIFTRIAVRFSQCFEMTIASITIDFLC